MRNTLLGVIALLLAIPILCHGQDQPDAASDPVNKITNFPTSLFSKVSSQTADLQQQLTRQTTAYLQRMARQEEKLRAKLYKADSAKAAALYPDDPKQQYATLIQKFRQDSSRAFHSMGPEYLPNADSLHGALSFLSRNPALLNASPALQSKMQGSLASLQQLQAKLQAADVIKQFIQARQAHIQQVIGGFSHVPSGISNALSGYKKQAYYYSAQVRAYRDMLNDPGKMMQTALVLLNKVPAFTSFMKKNSFLSGIMGVPAGYGSEQGTQGLQTRDQVMSMIQSKIGSGGPNAASSLQNSLNTAKQDISKLQNKLSSLGGGSGGMDMPDFKPNPEKTKTLWQRLEYGVNLQTAQTTYYYPTTTNVGVTVAYKLGSSNMIGVGGSYLLGWGDGLQHIAMSSQGVNFRAFLQIKIKSTFSADGELGYSYEQPFSSFKDIRSLSTWTPTGYIGITKTISMKSTVFKKTQVSLLWDVLTYIYPLPPGTSPFVFRVGYSL
jgi:hypothetical protein